ncbi:MULTISPECIES: TetR/AcrR family transcriptional regulator [Pseudofrankia]|uniref:TetR/AcrR family transcriptional regulator n=1 Tax=Pseudofrankia TaxID=2994363 RepID=UPI000234C4AB|nr:MULTISPECIES: TetR/AcrR family transcriptional regulator [Pseudofrankia]OHV29178.1 TetR family transcriptional regulator [Pseudofrankia sp. EUN1h]
MASPRRVGAETSKTRAMLLDRTEQIMLHEGYAAVTYRGVAARAGVAPGLVQYYFPTFNDLFLAIVRRRTEQSLEWLTELLRAGQPLRALWTYVSDKTGSALTAELMALANHHKKIRAEMAESGERIRALVLDALSESSSSYGGPQQVVPPDVVAFLISGAFRLIASEESVGMSTSHAETASFIEWYLDQFEPRHPDGSQGATPSPAAVVEAD